MRAEVELKYFELLRKPNKSETEIFERDRLRELWVAELKQETSGMIDELKGVGLAIDSVWDFVNTAESYPEAIDILVGHLSRQYHRRNKEGIVRALTVKEAKEKANATLFVEYNRILRDKENESLRWTIGNAIYYIVTSKDLESILPIVEDKKNGISRHRFVLALGKIKSEKAESALIKLLDDDQMTAYAIQALRRLKSKKAKEKISLIANKAEGLAKKEAEKFLNKIM